MAIDPPTKSVWPTFAWSLLSFCLLGAVAILGVRLFGSGEKEYDRTRAKERLENRQKLETEDRAQLKDYAWIDQAKGSVRLPIARAMELAVMELRQKPVGASGVSVVPPAAPPSADSPDAAAAPEPAASPDQPAAAPANPVTSPSATPSPSAP